MTPAGKVREAREALSEERRIALQQARQALYECFELSGADTSENYYRDPDGHVRPGIESAAVRAVKDLRADYDNGLADDATVAAELVSLKDALERIEALVKTRRLGIHMDGSSQFGNPLLAEIWAILAAAREAEGDGQ